MVLVTMMLRLLCTAYLSLSVLATDDVYGADRVISSGTERTALIELYTSEGCSSCPPADRWLSALRDHPRLWQDFIPIGFHVDYWDYIGWDDRFAKPEYADRQRRYAAQGGARFVYTPGVFLTGEEWVGWRSNGTLESDRSTVGSLSLAINGESVAIHFDEDESLLSALTIHVATVGMNLTTQVRAGENMGETLHHDFVALGVVTAALNKTAVGHKAVVQLPASDLPREDLAIVAWVSAAGSEAPIQSVGGYLVDPES